MTAVLLHVVNYLHKLLAQSVGLLHSGSLAVYTDDRLGVRLAKVNPLVGEVDLNAVDISNLLALEHLLNLLENSVDVGRRSKVDAVLCNLVAWECGT